MTSWQNDKLTKYQLTKYQLTKWQVDKTSTDKISTIKISTDKMATWQNNRINYASKSFMTLNYIRKLPIYDELKFTFVIINSSTVSCGSTVVELLAHHA